MSGILVRVFVLLALLTSLSGTYSYGQQQVDNSGFEDWEEIRSEVEEPVNWNSIKNTDGGKMTNRLAPEVYFKSETAHSGKYSLKLVNESTVGIIANGMVTNGAIHGEMDKSKSYVYTDTSQAGFSTTFMSRPDSVTGWYIYSPVENDSAMVVVLLHEGYITLPDHGTKSSWYGGVKVMLGSTGSNSWKRFSAPIQYFKEGNPKFILVVFSAGNRQNAIEGSTAFFDDIKLIYNKKE